MKRRGTYEFLIKDISFPGTGIGYIDNLRVEIKGTLPGQKVLGKITKKNKTRIVAKLVEVIEDVDYKIKAPCSNFELACGGCTFQDLNYKKQLEFKEKQLLKLFKDNNYKNFEYLNLEDSPKVFNYRNKMEFTFGDFEKDGPLTLGMHLKNRKYSIINASGCQIVQDDFSKILTFTLEYFREKKLPFYRVMKREGFLRHLVIRLGENTKELLVNLITTSQLNFDLSEWLIGIKNLQLENELKGILHTTNDSFSDIVQCDSLEVLWGRSYIYENLLNLKFKINPFSFFQTNSLGAEKLYSIVQNFVGETSNQVIFDLYCGTGTIGQIVAQNAKKVIGVELIKEAVLDARENAKLNNIDNTKFIAGDIAKVIVNIKEQPDIIILDPPRPGVHPFAMDYVIKFNSPKIIYISCNPKTLLIDLEILRNNDYKLKKVVGKDMFPHTPHLEAIVLLEKETKL